MEVEPVSNGVQQDSREAGKQIMESIKEEVASSGSNGRNADLSVHIPPRPVVFGSSRSGKGLLQSQSSFKGNSTPRSLLQSLSFKNKAVVPDGEGSSLLNQDAKQTPESPVLASIISKWQKCVSLPGTPASMFSSSVTTPTDNISGEQRNSQKSASQSKMSRSLSVPMRNVVIVRSGSFAIRKDPVQKDTGDDDQISHVEMEDDDEEIPEEEAVCRICLVSLCEGGNTFKLECSCKGDLNLTHEACVVKWFSIKGNKNCDVCRQEVRNLPVTVLRVQSCAQREYRRGENRQNPPSQPLSVWHDLVLLILISSISYFFILEQLLISEMKSNALALAAPFAFTLGLLGSMFAIVLALKEYIWTYAAFEFALVALNLHIFYSILHLNATYAILLSAVLGFGIALSVNSLYLYITVYRARLAERQISPDPV
ncbi:RING/U-box superfamily protein [Thalictrum thalictroides]|uniref:RING/U-box superfamily protein n=1 Tax=Thalictrum thalictroides TaxID=46969 RepID=A0A7J6X3J3_THATH|nr:RING/U-box superfamily protein [Thalictrum thalictroides]